MITPNHSYSVIPFQNESDHERELETEDQREYRKSYYRDQMCLFVKSPSGSVMRVQLPPNATLHMLKQIIRKSRGIPTDQQCLFHRGTLLQNDETRLMDFDIAPDDTIALDAASSSSGFGSEFVTTDFRHDTSAAGPLHSTPIFRRQYTVNSSGVHCRGRLAADMSIENRALGRRASLTAPRQVSTPLDSKTEEEFTVKDMDDKDVIINEQDADAIAEEEDRQLHTLAKKAVSARAGSRP